MFTTLAELYDMICKTVAQITGRPTWSKMGIQAAPNTPYAVVYIHEGRGPDLQVVETVELTNPDILGNTLQELVWGATTVDVEVTFYKDTVAIGKGTTALTAATAFRNGLYRTARDYDIWTLAGLSGPVRVIDTSAIFRADTENRAQVLFRLNVNLIDPITPALDTNIQEIDSQPLIIIDNGVTIDKTITYP